MFSPPWFHVPELPRCGESWLLSREEARHATASKRLSAGDAVVLFDGHGLLADATIGSGRERDGALAVRVHELREARERGRLVHLACALPKGDRLATLVDMTSQLGIASFTPLRCERSVVRAGELRAERIRRIQVEACKQAHWAWLPELRDEASLEEIVARGGTVLIAHPGGAADPRELGAGELTLCVGPEGGFTERELALVDEARRLDLGASVLRIETAAVVGVAAVRAARRTDPSAH